MLLWETFLALLFDSLHCQIYSSKTYPEVEHKFLVAQSYINFRSIETISTLSNHYYETSITHYVLIMTWVLPSSCYSGAGIHYGSKVKARKVVFWSCLGHQEEKKAFNKVVCFLNQDMLWWATGGLVSDFLC